MCMLSQGSRFVSVQVDTKGTKHSDHLTNNSCDTAHGPLSNPTAWGFIEKNFRVWYRFRGWMRGLLRKGLHLLIAYSQ